MPDRGLATRELRYADPVDLHAAHRTEPQVAVRRSGCIPRDRPCVHQMPLVRADQRKRHGVAQREIVPVPRVRRTRVVLGRRIGVMAEAHNGSCDRQSVRLVCEPAEVLVRLAEIEGVRPNREHERITLHSGRCLPFLPPHRFAPGMALKLERLALAEAVVDGEELNVGWLTLQVDLSSIEWYGVVAIKRLQPDVPPVAS